MLVGFVTVVRVIVSLLPLLAENADAFVLLRLITSVFLDKFSSENDTVGFFLLKSISIVFSDGISLSIANSVCEK